MKEEDFTKLTCKYSSSIQRAINCLSTSTSELSECSPSEYKLKKPKISTKHVPNKSKLKLEQYLSSFNEGDKDLNKNNFFANKIIKHLHDVYNKFFKPQYEDKINNYLNKKKSFQWNCEVIYLFAAFLTFVNIKSSSTIKTLCSFLSTIEVSRSFSIILLITRYNHNFQYFKIFSNRKRESLIKRINIMKNYTTDQIKKCNLSNGYLPKNYSHRFYCI